MDVYQDCLIISEAPPPYLWASMALNMLQKRASAACIGIHQGQCFQLFLVIFKRNYYLVKTSSLTPNWLLLVPCNTTYNLNPIYFHEWTIEIHLLSVGNTDQGSTLWIVGGEDGDFAHNTSEFLTLNDSVPIPGQCCQLFAIDHCPAVQKFPKNEQPWIFLCNKIMKNME